MSAGSSPIAARLAERICAFDPGKITARAAALARTAIIDTVGVTLAGLHEDCTRLLLETPGVAEAPGRSLILGTARRTSALDATLVNGTASHALDYDDFSVVLGGHQSVPLVPALLALADERGGNGQDFLLAYVVGVETESRLARAVNFHHYDKGWHPTATLGIFGTVAACARMLRLDAPRTATALAIAASLASGLKANFGTMTKPLHIGHSARNGLLATLLAERGFDAGARAFEHPQGFLEVFNGAGTYDIERAFAEWGEPLEVEDPGMALKQFPCCGSTHPAVMLTLGLAKDEGIDPSEVSRVEVMPHRRRLRHTDNPDPRTPLEAKFSVQYAVARALLDGELRLAHFEGEAHREPAVRRFLERVEARPHPDMADDAPSHWGAEVVITLADGRRLARRAEDLVGRGGNDPMSTEELWRKFSDCAQRALPADDIPALFEALGRLDSLDDLRPLVRRLEGGGPPLAEREAGGG